MKKLARLTLGLLIVTMIACDKKGSDPAPAPPPVAQYGYVNNACYDITTNTPVAANLCANVVINGSYRWNGVTCTDANGTAVAQSFCNIGTNLGTNYRWINNQCVDVNSVPVAATLCQSGAGGMFQLIGGNCFHTYTGQWVNYSYCSGVTGYNANACNGWFVKYYGAGLSMTMYCQGNLCSGQTLIEYMTGKQVTCP